MEENEIRAEGAFYSEPPATPPVSDKNEMKKIYSKIALWLGISYVAAMVVAIILSSVLTPIGKDPDSGISSDTVSLIVSFAPMYLICFPLIIFMLWKMDKAAPKRTKLGGGRVFSMFTMVFPIAVVGNIIGTVLSMVLSGGKAQNGVVDLVTSFNPGTVIIGSFVGPIFEEIVFRKIIIDRTVKYGEKAAILFSGLCFGMFHMNFFQFFYSFGLGLLLGYIYVRSGNLKITILFHVVFNSLSTIVVPLLMNLSEYNKFAEMIPKNGQITEEFIEQNMAFLQEHIVWIILYMLYAFIYFAMIITGIVMMIVKSKKIEIHETETQIPSGTGINAALINKGMIIYFIITALIITINLISA